MADPTKAGAAAQTETVEERSLLDQIVDQGRFGKDEKARDRGRDLVSQFVEEVMKGTMTLGRDTEAMINKRVAEIDALVSEQLNEVMHHPEFQKLEASWRGLKYLLSQSETSDMLRIKVLNVSKRDLFKDLESASEFDQSALFKKVHDDGYGVFGGAPMSALLGDYEFGKGNEDMALLERISSVAAAAHAPFMSAANSDMFGLESFSEIDAPRDLAQKFTSVEHAKWKAFRATDDSRYVALTCPRILMRDPYGSASKPVEAFNYEEGVDGTNHDNYLWGNAAWALGARVTNAFALYGWCATIRGVESGGLVTGLPVHTFRTDSGDIAMKCPTEARITDRREKELADLGFAALVHQKDTPNACFFSVQSAQKPKLYMTDAASANSRISAQIPYIFAVSRFAHYLKVIMRDKVGSFMSRTDAELLLNNWIANYVVGNDTASQEVKAKRPLREARVDVTEIPGKPGAYRAVAFLRPHFQLDELSVSMRLVADLPAPAK